MGAPVSDEERVGNVQPQHLVTLTPFYLQSTTVTVGQFALFDREYTTIELSSLKNKANQPTCPAIRISWYDSVMFALWLRGRLPLEAEWEFACRAGSEEMYCRISDGRSYRDLNTKEDLRLVAHFGNIEGTIPVGSKQSNLWGLFDMHGNVWELCQDWYYEHYHQVCLKQRACDDPPTPEEGNVCVLRGGSWYGDAWFARSAARSSNGPGYGGYDFGFRILLPRT